MVYLQVTGFGIKKKKIIISSYVGRISVSPEVTADRQKKVTVKSRRESKLESV